MDQSVYHIPALLPQVIEGLDIRPGGVYADVTYGGGGHSREILARLGPEGHLYGFDQDRDAVAAAPRGDERFTIVHSNFRFLRNFMRYHGVEWLDGLLADLGVSFHHFDDSARGFSLRFPQAPLDMRMNTWQALTAADVLNTYTEEELCRVLRLYGEIGQPGRLARAIAGRRATAPLATAADLIAVAAPLLAKPGREATQKDLAPLFQALRIEVNDEMGALRQLLEQAAQLLRPGSGRLCIISYHSLEDRMVKNYLRDGNLEGIRTTDIYGRTSTPFTPVSRRAIRPDEAEIAANPRSRSARLRVAVRNQS